MNDLDGITLKEILIEPDSSKQLTQTEFLEVCIKVIRLLLNMHKLGIVYSNIEPEHIFVDIQTHWLDDNVIKSHRYDILEWNIDSLLNSMNASSRSVKIKSSSERK